MVQSLLTGIVNVNIEQHMSVPKSMKMKMDHPLLWEISFYLTCNGRRFRYYMMVRSLRKATLWWEKILITNRIFHKLRKVKRTAKFNISAHLQAI